MPVLEVSLGTDTVGRCCRVAKYITVPNQSSSCSGQGVGRKKLACKLGRNSQLLAVSLRRAFITCLSGTIATVSHNLQTGCPKRCWPGSPEGAVFVPCCHGTSSLCDRRRACDCMHPRRCASAHDLHAVGNPAMAHTARGCLHPGDGICAGKLPAPQLTNQVKLT